MIRRLLVPYLMGKRRDGLQRVREHRRGHPPRRSAAHDRDASDVSAIQAPLPSSPARDYALAETQRTQFLNCYRCQPVT